LSLYAFSAFEQQRF
ncbi:hypothetical protein, partial [Salmonella enterica]